MILIVKTIVALAMLVRRFNFQMAIGAPPVSLFVTLLRYFSNTRFWSLLTQLIVCL